MSQQQVTAAWALISKQPEVSQNYGVLAASDDHVGELTVTYVAGIPSSSLPADSPLAPPWVTFGSHPLAEGRTAVSISVQDRWEGNDQAGRPIWPRRFFLCQHDQVASARASYQTLWDAVGPVRLPLQGRQPVTLDVRTASLSAIVATIKAIGFRRVAAIAAALLQSPVVVTGTARLGLEARAHDRGGGANGPIAGLSRLAVLDAIAALLPYGFRAELTASSAVDNAMLHRIRLVLADYAKEGQFEAPLRGAPLKLGADAYRYYGELVDKEANDGGVLAVVTHLWNAGDSCSFDNRGQALGILRRLNQLGSVSRFIERAEESLENSLHALDMITGDQVAQLWRSQDEIPERRFKVIRPLLQPGDPRATAMLRANWDALSEDLITLANRRLDRGDADVALRCLAIADDLSPAAADSLLMKLISPPRDPDPTWTRSPGARSALLRWRPVPEPGGFRKTGLVLRVDKEWQEAIVRDCLYALIAEETGVQFAARYAEWLCQPESEAVLPRWGEALWFVLTGADGGSGTGAVREHIQRSMSWAVIDLSLATHRGHLPAVLGSHGLADDLLDLTAAMARRAEPQEVKRVLARGITARLWDHGLEAGTIATVDAARVLIGGSPISFPHASTQQAGPYSDVLRRVLENRNIADLRDWLYQAFLDHLVRDQLNQKLSAGTITFLLTMPSDQVLANYVADSPPVTEALLGYDELDSIWHQLARLRPDLERTAATPMLRGAVKRTIRDPGAALLRKDITSESHAGPDGLSWTPLATAIYQARRAGMPAIEILKVMASTQVEGRRLVQVISPRQLDDVLREYEVQSRRANVDLPTTARPEFYEFEDLIIRGALDGVHGSRVFGEQFRLMVKKRNEDEEALRKVRAREVARPPRELRRSSRGRPAAPARQDAPKGTSAGQPGAAQHAGAGVAGARLAEPPWAPVPPGQAVPPGQPVPPGSQQPADQRKAPPWKVWQRSGDRLRRRRKGRHGPPDGQHHVGPEVPGTAGTGKR